MPNLACCAGWPRNVENMLQTSRLLGVLEAEKPTQNPEIPKKTPRLRELFRKVRANFSLLSCDTSQEPNGNYSEKLVQMNFLILGGFFRVDFPPVMFLSLDIPRGSGEASQYHSRDSFCRSIAAQLPSPQGNCLGA